MQLSSNTNDSRLIQQRKLISGKDWSSFWILNYKKIICRKKVYRISLKKILYLERLVFVKEIWYSYDKKYVGLLTQW